MSCLTYKSVLQSFKLLYNRYIKRLTKRRPVLMSCLTYKSVLQSFKLLYNRYIKRANYLKKYIYLYIKSFICFGGM